MIQLTREQRQELHGPDPARAIDPETQETYVLVREEVFERIKTVFDEDGLDMRQVAVLVQKAMRDDDADDPALESYQKYRL